MNIKKALLITVIVLAIFSSFSVVSAGWFDFLGGGDSNVVDNVTVDIISSSVNYKCSATGNGLSVQSNGNSFNVTDSNEQDKEITYKGNVKINVSSLDQDQLKNNLSNANWTATVVFGDISGGLSYYVHNYTLENGTLTFYFNGTEGINSYDPVKPGDSGITNVTSGDILIYKEGSHDDSAFIINF